MMSIGFHTFVSQVLAVDERVPSGRILTSVSQVKSKLYKEMNDLISVSIVTVF